MLRLALALGRYAPSGLALYLVYVYTYWQTVQVSRFQRDPPDFTRSIPFPDAPPSGVYKIPLFLEASRTIGAYACKHMRALRRRGSARL